MKRFDCRWNIFGAVGDGKQVVSYEAAALMNREMSETK